jgi:hypothetical protein
MIPYGILTPPIIIVGLAFYVRINYLIIAARITVCLSSLNNEEDLNEQGKEY